MHILAHAARDACQVVSQDIVAVLLLTLAESIATPTPDGRPKGTSSLNADDAKRLMEIHRQDDGSSGARGWAIAAVVLAEKEHKRPAIMRRLRRKAKAAESTGGTDIK